MSPPSRHRETVANTPKPRIVEARRPSEDGRYQSNQLIASKYRLVRMLGEGGMGSVWLARNETLDVDVAIKLIRRDGSQAASRLLREARAAARLEHPSIVRVYDFGESDQGDPFIVMEVVRGESLADVLDRKGRLPALNAVQMLLPVASALSAAHARGIVHRDVKPENIILMAGDKGTIVPKLVDFGIAKMAVSEDPPSRDRRNRPLTQVGMILGSPDYMSPEQALASNTVDERSDIWALSVVLYETICGRRPFDGDTVPELTLAIMRKAPRPTTELGAGDAKLWRILQRGLEKEPEERWKSMLTMGSLLAQWLHDNGVHSDVSGASLALHWLNEGVVRPLSQRPSMPDESGARPIVPTPAPKLQSALAPPRPKRWWWALPIAALALTFTAWFASKPTVSAVVEHVPQREVLPPPERAPSATTTAASPVVKPKPAAAAAPKPKSKTKRTTHAPAPRKEAAPSDPGF